MSDTTLKYHDEIDALEAIVLSNDHLQLASFLENLPPVDFARAFFRFSRDDQIHLLEMLGPEKSAKLCDFFFVLSFASVILPKL